MTKEKTLSREEIFSECLGRLATHNMLALELPTGMGKSKMAIDLTNRLLHGKEGASILLLVAKRAHKRNWADEIAKWGGLAGNPALTVECYESLKKHAGETFDIIIADEAHHLKSELRQELFGSLKAARKTLLLSATFPRELKAWLWRTFRCSFVSSSLAEAIHADILPSPEIILLPLRLDNKAETELIEVNPKAKGAAVAGTYAKDYWTYRHSRIHARLKATKKQYLQWLNTEILKAKNSWERGHFEGMKLRWLKLCGDRLKFLASCKNGYVKGILSRLDGCRTLTFCASIKQAEALGRYCVHSKNGESADVLREFNEGKIDHITACQILNEGMNLVDCQYGIFANINASRTVQVQRLGRLLRHHDPVIIIPFYKDTREEEIVSQMLQGYDSSLVRTCDGIDNFLIT